MLSLYLLENDFTLATEPRTHREESKKAVDEKAQAAGVELGIPTN